MRISTRRGIQGTVSPTVPAPFFTFGRTPLLNGATDDSLTWPVHSPVYALGPTALPGHAGYGMDSRGGSGRNLTTRHTNVIFVNTLSSAAGSLSLHPTITRPDATIWVGSWRAAWQSSLTPKVIIPLVAGWINIGGTVNTSSGVGFMSYLGQFAPQPGLFLRGASPRINGGSDMQVWHLRSYVGDDSYGGSYDDGGQRDALAHGIGTILTATRNVFICNDLAWAIDEIAEQFYPCVSSSWLYNNFLEPLHRSIIIHPEDGAGVDHGFGPLYGGHNTQSTNCSVYRNAFGMTTGRNPQTTVRNMSIANNIMYDHGRPGGGQGNAVHWHANSTLPMLTNVVGNLFLRGPDNNNSMVAVALTVGVPAGSQTYIGMNGQRGWTNPPNQNGFLTSSAPSGWLASSPLTAALPSFWGDSGLSGVLQWAVDPLAPTQAEALAFINLMDDSVGAQPGFRSATYGRVANMYSAMRSSNAGASISPLFVDTVDQAGGWFTVPSVSAIDPLNPGSHWHEPFPSGNLCDILTSGTLSNGLSAVGYTRLEAWWLNQHYYVGGK